MFYPEVHTALSGVEIRCFYLQGKEVLQVYRHFLCNKFMLNNSTLTFQEACNGVVQKNVTAQPFAVVALRTVSELAQE
jgi:hypothetical protein